MHIYAASDSERECQNRDFLVYMLYRDHSNWNAIFDPDAFLYAKEWKLSFFYVQICLQSWTHHEKWSFLLHKSHPQLIVHISSLHILILKWRCVPENGFQRLNVYIKLHESGTFSFLNCMWKPGYSSFFVSSAIVYCLDNCHLRSFPFKF